MNYHKRKIALIISLILSGYNTIVPSSPFSYYPGFVNTLHLAEDLQAIIDQQERVVLEFHAPWCTFCHRFDPVLRRSAHQYPMITFIKIDIQTFPQMKDVFKIKGLPAFRFYFKGKEVDRLGGANEGPFKQKVAVLANRAS